ncbi:MAG TPA: molecular chaperone HtpG, partial [Planctomycetaceae bacterium]|nr:molecular chaperone HtpG [Planctomycetaceae bacterium]
MTTAEKQQFTFQAEIRQLLHLLSHSLYQNKEITIRELVSNASDSLNKMRHIQLSEERYRDEAPLEISLEPDAEKRILTIRDNGVGLTHEELVTNLGTIAHSGSLEFLNKLSGDAKADLSLIGQFGVGFYSAFMLADKVEVVTRSYLETAGWRWESDGSGSYSIEPADDVPRGAQVRLHLKKDLDEFTNPHRLRTIIRKYSTFVPHPVKLEGEQLNEQRPIWVEPKSQLTDEQYNGFYQYLTHHSDEQPLWRLHLSSDSPLQFHAILYCPPQNLELLGFGRFEEGLHLCAKRILVQDDCRDLLPEYLRFLRGLVDSEDLPLNVSRETLQDSAVLKRIGKVLTKRVLDYLATFADENAEQYLEFYKQFGMVLRTGISNDFEHREKIAKLLRLRSSHNPDEFTSLDAYRERAGEEQKQIYYLGGPDLASIRKNPNLEIFRKRGIEVLYLPDPVDEFVLTNLGEYEKCRLVSIDDANIELPPETAKEGAEEKAEEPAAPEKPQGFEAVLDLFRTGLGDKVVEVRESKRLTDSPCCLVNPQGAMSAQLERALHMANQDYELSKRIFEVNP